MLQKMAETEKPDLIIGTSMGGMYTELLKGFDRILVNPAFKMGDTMSSMTGKQEFQKMCIRDRAYAMRAFEYFTLIQLYQFTYKGHEDAAGVPLVTEKTTESEANNNPRAAVKLSLIHI